MSATKIAALIVTYKNTPRDVGTVIESLLANGLNVADIYILENSRDTEYLVALTEKYPELHVACCVTNSGYAAGNNILMRWAFCSPYNLALICNPDIAIISGSIAEIESVAAKEENIGIIGGFEYDGHARTLRTAGGAVYRKWTSRATWRNHGRGEHSYDVPFVQGAFFGVTNKIYEKGLEFPEWVGMYYDEVVLGMIAAELGFRCVCCENVGYYHYNNSGPTLTTGYWHHRNRVLVCRWKGSLLSVLVFTTYLYLVEMPIKSCYWFLRRGRAGLRYSKQCWAGVFNGYVSPVERKEACVQAQHQNLSSNG